MSHVPGLHTELWTRKTTYDTHARNGRIRYAALTPGTRPTPTADVLPWITIAPTDAIRRGGALFEGVG